ncbi:HAD-IA family hydrolase [Streptomyces smyrnaeus]|uniref:HAD-IA family hydrolase n=1 Tax=Streptomyces smyrnaeus TaxID=1387713 RepID=A0ABS3Y1K4_9ACTN|nr:HAD-IA family hydrolase [Streptomyces smyrnaeus]MBO8201413.1 HAD-IA family hydrolase [Streptomyces smyrnaeus]
MSPRGSGHEGLLGFRALTFDVVGTLIDFEAGIVECVRRVAGPDGSQRSDEEILRAFGAAEDEQQQRTPAMPFTQMLDPISARLAAHLGLPALDGRGAPSPLRLSIAAWPAFPDAREALAALHRRFRLVAVTNADNAAARAMSSTLGGPFDDVVTAEDVGVNKPDPQVFAYCQGRLGTLDIARSEVLHVAQSQYHDIGVARQLGYATCWIERRRGRAGSGATPPPRSVTAPDHHFGTLAELAAAVEEAPAPAPER